MNRLFVFFCFVTILISCNLQDKNAHTLSANIAQDKEYLVVKGKSNLPDQSQITVALYDVKENPPVLIVQEFGLVEKGEFKARFKPLKKISAGKYTVRLHFSPASYDWSGGKVIEKVGKNGELLKGSLVNKDSDGMFYLEKLISIEYKEP